MAKLTRKDDVEQRKGLGILKGAATLYEREMARCLVGFASGLAHQRVNLPEAAVPMILRPSLRYFSIIVNRGSVRGAAYPVRPFPKI